MSNRVPHESLSPSRPCAVYGQLFRPRWPKGKYCSALCRGKANAARRPGRKQAGPSTVDIPAEDPPPWEEEPR